MHSLNGWHRLGIVMSAVWFVVVGAVVAESALFPSISSWLRPCPENSDPLCLFNELSAFRLSLFAGVPVVAMWAVGYAVAWIRGGFREG